MLKTKCKVLFVKIRKGTIMQKFGERLKELRFKNRYTQKQVADDLGMTFSALSQYENGKRTPKNEVLIQLAAYYNVSVDYLLGLNNNPIKEYDFTPADDNVSAASNTVYTYDSQDDNHFETDLTSSKARVLASINRLPKSKQLEVLAAIELLLGTIAGA